MPIQSLQALSPEPRRAAETYLGDVARALSGTDPAMLEDLLPDLESHLLERLDASSTADDVSRLIAELGSPDSFSAELSGGAAPQGGTGAGAGKILGIPYDVRIPTAQRIAERLWNPRDPRLLMPRVFGMGWDVNFGAVAVRLHLIEPDSEDVPFTSTPNSAFLAALAVPVALTSAMLISYLALRGVLPARLPSHWNIYGVADDFWDHTAFGMLFLLALLPTLWAAWSVLRHRAPLLRGATLGLAGLFAALSSLLWVLTLVTVLTGFVAWWLPPLLICIGIVVGFGVFLWLARAGRKAEQQRDFANAS